MAADKKISQLPKGRKIFRMLTGWLDELGENYHIERITASEFTLSLNFENIRSAKTRQTLNKHLIRRFNQLTQET